jgi:ABC-type spermidine/putrescine transport system permease subunit I
MLVAVTKSRKALRDWYWSATVEVWVLRAFVLSWSVLVLLPLLILLAYSFFETKSFVTIYKPTLSTWISLFDSGRWEVALRTLRIALTVTLFELLIAFPFALWLAKGCKSKVTKAVVLALLTIPFFLDISSRTIVWRAILGQNGLVNVVLQESGLISEPLQWLLYSEFSVHFGMLAPYFPTMVLPIYLAVTLISDDLLKASNDLGASPFQTLVRVIIPLSLPGILAGVIFTLGPALAAWVEPGMLGGGFVNLLSHSIESAYTALRYPIVAALSAFIIALLSILLLILVVVTRRTANMSSLFRAMHQ